jgi:hypothetical protein
MDLLRNIAPDLQLRQLPVEWTEIEQESDASRAALERERLGNFTVEGNHNNHLPPADADDDDVVIRPAAVMTEQQRRGQEILALCFQSRFDELRVKLFEFHQRGLDFVVDWLTKDEVSDMHYR